MRLTARIALVIGVALASGLVVTTVSVAVNSAITWQLPYACHQQTPPNPSHGATNGKNISLIHHRFAGSRRSHGGSSRLTLQPSSPVVSKASSCSGVGGGTTER